MPACSATSRGEGTALEEPRLGDQGQPWRERTEDGSGREAFVRQSNNVRPLLLLLLSSPDILNATKTIVGGFGEVKCVVGETAFFCWQTGVAGRREVQTRSRRTLNRPVLLGLRWDFLLGKVLRFGISGQKVDLIEALQGIWAFFCKKVVMLALTTKHRSFRLRKGEQGRRRKKVQLGDATCLQTC